MADDPSSLLPEIRALITRRDQLEARMNAASWDDGSYRELEEKFTAAQDRLAARTPALLAAVEAALELHQPVDYGTGAQCKGCATHVTFTRWPCRIVAAITGALGGTPVNDSAPAAPVKEDRGP